MLENMNSGNSYVPSVPKSKLRYDIDVESCLCDSPVFSAARSRLAASGGGRGGLGTDGWENYIYGDQPPPRDDAENRARIGRTEELREAGFGKEQIRGVVKTEATLRKAAKKELGTAVKAKAVALVAKKGARVAAEGETKAAKTAAKALAPAEEREARAARNADLAARVAEFQAAKAAKGKAKAVGAFTANAIKNVMKREAQREVAEEAKAKGTFTSPAKAVVAPPSALLKADGEGVPVPTIQIERLQTMISVDREANKRIGIVAGKASKNGQGYKPAIKLPSGDLVPYNAAETTLEQLGELVQRFTALREKTTSGTKEYQTITNFLRVIRKEKDKRISGGLATPRAKGKASGGGGAASARAGGGGEEDEDEE
jgi:hypothetical protein